MSEINDDDEHQLLAMKLSTSKAEPLLPGVGEDLDDLAVYQRLFDELKKEPPGGLPANFSANVVNQIRRRKHVANDGLFYLLLGVGALLSLFYGFVLMASIDIGGANGLLSGLNDAKLWFIFGLICLVLVQVLDHKLAKSHLLAHH
jgi:hypothetical protein